MKIKNKEYIERREPKYDKNTRCSLCDLKYVRDNKKRIVCNYIHCYITHSYWIEK